MRPLFVALFAMPRTSRVTSISSSSLWKLVRFTDLVRGPGFVERTRDLGLLIDAEAAAHFGRRRERQIERVEALYFILFSITGRLSLCPFFKVTFLTVNRNRSSFCDASPTAGPA